MRTVWGSLEELFIIRTGIHYRKRVRARTKRRVSVPQVAMVGVGSSASAHTHKHTSLAGAAPSGVSGMGSDAPHGVNSGRFSFRSSSSVT